MTFSDPVWLAALALIPAAIAASIVARRRARRYAVRFTAFSTLLTAAGAASGWRNRLPAALLLASIVVLALTLARPHVSYSAPLDEASVVLVSDESGSMAAPDVQPTRLAAAQRAANTFIDQLPAKAQVGAVAFSTSPNSVQAPAVDHGAARSVIDSQTAGGATDTGDSLAEALQLLRGGRANHPALGDRAVVGRGCQPRSRPDGRCASGGKGQDPDLHGRARDARRHAAQSGPVRATGARPPRPTADGAGRGAVRRP